MAEKKSEAELEQEAQSYFKGEFEVQRPPLKRAAYSDRMAFVMASMAHLAYDHYEDGGKDKELFEIKLKGGGFTLLDTFNSKETDTQAFLAKNDEFNYAVLAFRGTEVTKKKDVLTDAKALKVSMIEGSIHKGFLEAYNSVKDDIEQSLKKVLGMPLYITGHSLGAALATVATNYLEEVAIDKAPLKDQIAACYTFGSPRVGNTQFNREFRSAIYRVVNTTDIVTVVPLLAMGYVHLGDVRFLGRGDRDIWTGIPTLRRIGFFLAAIFRLFGPWVGDHGIIVYRDKLAKLANNRSTKLLFVDGRSGGR